MGIPGRCFSIPVFLFRHGARAADGQGVAIEPPDKIRPIAFAAAVAPVNGVVMDCGDLQR